MLHARRELEVVLAIEITRRAVGAGAERGGAGADFVVLRDTVVVGRFCDTRPRADGARHEIHVKPVAELRSQSRVGVNESWVRVVLAVILAEARLQGRA